MLGNCHTLIFLLQRYNESVKMLGNCHTIDITNTYITDESVKLLGNCHRL